MDAGYWHTKWAQGDINFHQADFNTLMTKNFQALGLQVGAHVFVPLCGKTRDIAWLLQQGYRVTGVELNEDAVIALFHDLGLHPDVSQDGSLLRYATVDLVVFVGDIFAVSRLTLGPVHAVYDRAALVALPDTLRADYAAHISRITDGAMQFILTFTYDQSQMNGPPFSVTNEMLADLYGATYQREVLERVTLPGKGLKGRVPATETAWALTPRSA